LEARLVHSVSVPEIVVILGAGGIFVVPFWRILAKAGYPEWLSLLMLLPGFNLAILFFLAFSKWPIEREMDALRPRY
jgi:hypothetical protein